MYRLTKLMYCSVPPHEAHVMQCTASCGEVGYYMRAVCALCACRYVCSVCIVCMQVCVQCVYCVHVCHELARCLVPPCTTLYCPPAQYLHPACTALYYPTTL